MTRPQGVEERQLIDAIFAAPDDDVPRLVYADPLGRALKANTSGTGSLRLGALLAFGAAL